MPNDEQALDSATDWVAEHTRHYVETDGAEGHLWRGVPTLVLTTTGRRSGKPRRNALIYGRDDANYVVVASKGGADNHPPLVLEPQRRSQRPLPGRRRQAARPRPIRLSRGKSPPLAPHGRHLARLQRLQSQNQPRHPRRHPRARLICHARAPSEASVPSA